MAAKLAKDTQVIHLAGTETVSGAKTFSAGVASTTPTSGSVIVTGGVGVSGGLNVGGHMSAATKAFIIPHPTKEGKRLQYACLEGPENGVYIRGKTFDSYISLPDYWYNLVDIDSVTVTLTPIGKFQSLYVIEQNSIGVSVGGASGEYNYVIYGERKDVAKLETEI